ncbi:hypothetical protein GN958_ATG08414 [Phytophthora infestans]|uniref:Uncharacterized protein n=1 Tax=Phytophthora infestans TaxID=4787 RepID=A0A8S9UVQ1_PHYIN|nr:hypothetical protein GN958_ATG08414 [Phytophthora infestans]
MEPSWASLQVERKAETRWTRKKGKGHSKTTGDKRYGLDERTADEWLRAHSGVVLRSRPRRSRSQLASIEARFQATVSHRSSDVCALPIVSNGFLASGVNA